MNFVVFGDLCRVFRYEDFSKETYSNSERVLKFFNFAMHDKVKAFLDSHTKSNVGGVSSTFRDSKTAPYHWKKDLTFDEIKVIQSDCQEALK